MNTEAGTPARGRSHHREALAQLREARALEVGPVTLDTVGTPTAVLNGNREVIYANRGFRELVGARNMEELCGNRPGEALGCANSSRGCGESDSCQYCGAAQAIMETQRSRQPATRECHITVDAPDRALALDLLVRTVPFEISGNPFVLLTLSDVSHLKRRQALERIFFHDILNTASSFKVYLDLLRRTTEDAGYASTRSAQTQCRGIISRLASISETLQEEIQGQKLMLSAENGTLQAQRQLIDSHGIVRQVIGQIEGLEEAQGRRMVIAPFSESFSFVSDDSLVRRVMANMLKNALEASPVGAMVTIAFGKDGKGNARFQVHNPNCIEAHAQKRIFSRYFSTKGSDRGLGTWGMRMLAQDYLGGSVTFTSTEEAGTTFVLSLPLKPRDF
jgi:signal transduction histidine kinase